MSVGNNVTGIPATERVVVGLCHGMNDQLAAISAYLFLLERRGLLGEAGKPLQDHLDRLAAKVRLLRSLTRDGASPAEPMAVSLLAESATELMSEYPEGPVDFRLRAGSDGGVVRCDWARALRALLLAGAWISRGVKEPVRVELTPGTDGDVQLLRALALGDHPSPPPGELHSDAGPGSIVLDQIGERAVVLRFPPAVPLLS
ncbi:MAG: hypothetical protein ABL963_10795 [Longimicrobiales bacterium]